MQPAYADVLQRSLPIQLVLTMIGVVTGMIAKFLTGNGMTWSYASLLTIFDKDPSWLVLGIMCFVISLIVWVLSLWIGIGNLIAKYERRPLFHEKVLGFIHLAAVTGCLVLVAVQMMKLLFIVLVAVILTVTIISAYQLMTSSAREHAR